MTQAAWIWWLSGGVLALTGLALLWWSLLRDRSRGRRRCPKCWYDMAGVPGLVCPECGRDARREKWLGKTRRRWKMGLLASLALFTGLGVGLTPRVRALGPASLLPTTVLVLACPTADQTWTTSEHQVVGFLEGLHDGMMIEIARRASERPSSLANWQWRYWIEHKGVIQVWRSQYNPSLVFALIEMPPPVGEYDQLMIRTVAEAHPGWLPPQFVGPVQPEMQSAEDGVISVEAPGTTYSVESGFLGPGAGSLLWWTSLSLPRRGPFYRRPHLDARLGDPASTSLLLDVEYRRKTSGTPSGWPPLDEAVVVWSGRVILKIRDDPPSGVPSPSYGW